MQVPHRPGPCYGDADNPGDCHRDSKSGQQNARAGTAYDGKDQPGRAKEIVKNEEP